MLHSLAIVSLLGPVVLALSVANVSPTCGSFLNSLDADDSLKDCTSSLANATAAYGAAKDNSKPITKDSITSTLDSICKPNVGCSDTVMKAKLSQFYANCGPELTTNNNNDVIELYDTVYSYIPLKQSICTKDDSGTYCVLKTSNVVQSQPTVLTKLQQYLWNTGPSALSKRADSAAPNMSTLSTTNTAFLLLSASLDYNTLCTSCTRNIMTKYMSWQSDSLYAPGLQASLLLSGETTLYEGITKTCGPQFMSSSVQAAGGLGKGSSSSNGSLKTFGLDLLAVSISVVTMAFATTL
ncbi:hypothetical protein E1B28_013684 [Marasmius oreades]|uniref:DUF7729 domain-containing protein n=1 Tax=Marasmius oreades TaxID=181124 RepID=A0A9P7RR54_9AGAR|nr:uncharacterized protein E1B28_013684 [Marasmius oreades]KAG7087741.1 hypothetical protein E1B28_013684 [Marasmius oreades]